MKWLIGTLIFGICYAADISQPPVDRELSLQMRQFLKEIADNFNSLEVVTTNPDGSKRGNYGDMVLFNSSGTYYLEICVSSPGTTWVGIQLSDTP